jgi:two-component system, cell cycle response regulator
MRVLIADDDTVTRLVLTKLLDQLGHECLAARDGEQAWELYRDGGAEVIISDWMMPGLDGLELCRQIREEPRGSYTYFVLLTALDDKHHFLVGMQQGADDYLTKPLDRDELQARLVAAERVTTLHRRMADQNQELERLNRELFAQARRDPLTAAYNRLQLHEDREPLRRWVEGRERLQCLALCDLDRFKVFCRIQQRGGRVYRYGGEEFCLWLPERSLTAAVAAMDGLRRAVEAMAIEHAGNEPSRVVTVSAGVAPLRPGDGKSMEALLQQADEALYRAKQAGRNRVMVPS